MLASRSLPAGFVLGGTLHLAGNRRLWLKLSLLSVPWGVVSAVGIAVLATAVRPEGWSFDLRQVQLPMLLAVMLGGLAMTWVLTIVLHEAVHGMLLWMFTGARPVFGFKGWYAYADAPGWYLKRWPMLASLAAPLVLLPAAGLPVIAMASAEISLFVLVGLMINAFAAIGDVYLITMALRIRGPVYFGDAPQAKPGEAGSWFVPAR
jgi:hypothetical protein